MKFIASALATAAALFLCTSCAPTPSDAPEAVSPPENAVAPAPSPEVVPPPHDAASDKIRATLEPAPARKGFFVIHMTNVSPAPIRFLDIREGDAGCGNFYEIILEKDGEKYESNGMCLYAPGPEFKVVELAPGQTYDREIQPVAYCLERGQRLLTPPFTIAVRYRVTDKMKIRREAGQPEKCDLDLVFQTDKSGVDK